LTAISVFAAISLMMSVCLFGAREADTSVAASPAVFVRGLMMLQLEQQDGLHIVLPDAPGHRATITFVMHDGNRQVIPFKGRTTIKTTATEASPAVVKVPELVRLKELFGSGITPLVDRAPNNILIPWSSIRMVSTYEVSASRFTFVRKDNGEEIATFRPRNIAETLRIQLSAAGQLNFNPLKSDIDASKVKEIWIEQVPKSMDAADIYREHFNHYLHYIARPAGQDFDVEPLKLTGAPSQTPRFGRSFWIGAVYLCQPVAID
jgi:hypothetical protein